jgi:hypothetical protein
MLHCHVWVQPPGSRSGHLQLHARKGIFRGFLPFTTKNILWYDVETKRVKIAFHAHSDEGMNNLANADLPLNAQHLQHIQNDKPLPPEPADISAPAFGFTSQPFSTEWDLHLPVSCTNTTFGFLLTILSASTAKKLCSTA